MQVASRFLLVWGIAYNFPATTQHSPAYSTMLLAWSFTEVVRYSYFVFTLSGLGVPPLLSFLRYNTFMILYPLGISSECWLVFKAIPGNHDPQAVWALAMTIAAYFSNEPRVAVDLNPSKFWFYRFGKVLIGSTHGDTVKHETLPGIMACDQPEDWGATRHRYWYTGHVHSQHVREFPGVVCESFRTLAAKDSYAAGHGYRAGRDMVCIVHHFEDGEVERHRCDVGRLKADLPAAA